MHVRGGGGWPTMRSMSGRRMHISPEQWSALPDTSPTDEDSWVRRLGGSGAAVLAVCGAINRGYLRGVGAGVLALEAAGSEGRR